MRGKIFRLILLLPLLVACKLLPGGGAVTPAPQNGNVTEAVSGESGTPGAIRPKQRPVPAEAGIALGAVDAEAPVAAAPPAAASRAEVTEDQLRCEKQGGRWGSVGKFNAKACIRRTDDGGKQCRKQSDCDSECLARSGTCAPVKPLFGCNEVLQNDGRRFTLCVE